MSTDFDDECALDEEEAMDDTRARLLFERGDMGVLPGGRYPVGLGNSERARVWHAVMGPSEEELAAHYEAELQRAYPDRYVRKMRRRPRGPSSSADERLISVRQFRELYNAVAFANLQGAILDTHITVSWSMLGFEDDSQISHALQLGLIKHAREWSRHKEDPLGRPFCWIYAHERGAKLGLHTHLLLFIPVELRPKFDAWLRTRVRKLARRRPLPNEKAVHISRVRSDRHRQLWHQWRQLGYLMKSVDPAATLPVWPGTSATVPLTDLVCWDHEGPGEVNCKLRVGIADELRATARSRAQYRSLLDWGVTDVRLLYSDWDYREWEWSQQEERAAELDPETAALLAGRVAAERAKADEEFGRRVSDWLGLVDHRDRNLREAEESLRRSEEARRAQQEAIVRISGVSEPRRKWQMPAW
jgi:hypothetical protein